MNFCAYEVLDNGAICRDIHRNYLELEYYKAPIVGRSRSLEILSQYLKQGDRSIEFLLNSNYQIRREEETREYQEWMQNSYLLTENM